MVANNDKLYDQWHAVKGQLRKRWGKLTEDDISKLSGKQEELAFALRRRYGYAEGQAMMEINRWLAEFDRDNVRPRK